MNKILNSAGEKLNLTEINVIPTKTISYIVAKKESGAAYLFRTLDVNEYVSEYSDRIYRGCDENSLIPLLFISTSDDYEELSDKAQGYKTVIEKTIKRSDMDEDNENRNIKGILVSVVVFLILTAVAGFVLRLIGL